VVRRLTGLGLAAASCAALVGAWRLGDQAHPSTATGAQVISTPQAASPSSPTPASPRTSAGAAGKPTSKPSASSAPAVLTVNGALVDTQYGGVRVQIVLTAGRLTDLRALQLTDSSSRSVSISAQAAPILRQEALAAGSAKIDTVSGASYTSEAYVKSLQSALDAARAAA
jgi:uncharacterized protein with FMN-binding domain